MATTVVYSDLKELPVTLSIGTRRAFDGGYQYTYRFVQEIQLYVCDQRTTTGVDGEVMAISISSDDDGNTWYVASEGQLSGSGDGQRFHGRQMVFRTRDQFWEAGEHEWQMNANSSATNTDDSAWGKSMSAVTQVDENVDKVIAAVGILGPANA